MEPCRAPGREGPSEHTVRTESLRRLARRPPHVSRPRPLARRGAAPPARSHPGLQRGRREPSPNGPELPKTSSEDGPQPGPGWPAAGPRTRRPGLVPAQGTCAQSPTGGGQGAANPCFSSWTIPSLSPPSSSPEINNKKYFKYKKMGPQAWVWPLACSLLVSKLPSTTAHRERCFPRPIHGITTFMRLYPTEPT